MRKLLLLLTVMLANFSFAQEMITNEEFEMIQELFGDEKRVVIQENINLNGVDADKFWKMYDEYEKQRQEIGVEKVKLLKQYSLKQGNMTEAQADEMLAQAVALRDAEDKLINNYARRLKKETNSFVSVQFYQIEHYISDGIRYAILNNIDFIQD